MKSCTFIGHRECHDGIIPKLLQTVEQLITQRSFDTFYVGTHGNFDRFAYHVLCQLENQYNIKVNVVLAYLTNNHNDFYNSNKTIFPSILENTPPRYAIVKRNNYMLDKAECVVCYVNDAFSNAYTFAKRAIKKNKEVINLGTYKFDKF